MAERVSTRLAVQEGRRFGLTVGTAFAVFGGIVLWRDHQLMAQIFWAIAVLLILGALVIPAMLKPVERIWMAGAHQISRVTTPIVMGIVYFLVLTPIALIVRRTKGNPLVHTHDETGYWLKRDDAEQPRSDMRRQF